MTSERRARRPASLAVLLAALLMAQGLPAADDRPESRVVPPPPPEALTQGEEIEPEVTIVRRSWGTFEEYSIRGRVYAVKVTPGVGPPYYLYDTDGDGVLDSRMSTLRDVPQTHQWRILTW